MDTFEVQKSNLSDLRELQILEKACFGRDQWPLLDLIGVLTFPGMIRLKAVMDQKMVGFIAGDTRKKGEGWITTIGVLPEFRRRGIAKKLLLCAEELMDTPVIKLTVRRGNNAAIQLYSLAGYQAVDVWKEYYLDGEDGLILEKVR